MPKRLFHFWIRISLCLILLMMLLITVNIAALAQSDTQAPSAPTGLSAADITRTSFTLNWVASTDNLGVKEYRVYRNDRLIGTTASHSYAVSALTLNTPYKMRVIALDHAGNPSKSSAILTVKTLADTVPPQAPTALQASRVSWHSFQLSWQPATDDVGVTRYDIYVNGVLKATNRITNQKLSASANINNLKADTIYTLTVKAYDKMNNGSALSLPLEVETLSDTIAPLPVTGLTADSLTSSGFRFLWDKTVDNLRVAQYEVFSNGVSLGKTTANQWTFSGLQPATGYSVSVKAYDESGNTSPLSPVLTVTTNSATVSSAHKLTFVSLSKPLTKSATTITYRLAEPSTITVKVYDTAGQLLQTPVDNVATKTGLNILNVSLGSLGSGNFAVKISAKKADTSETELWRTVAVDHGVPTVQILEANVDRYTLTGPNQVTVNYTISERATVSLRVMNSANKPVRTVVGTSAAFPGQHTWLWDGKNQSGVLQPAGNFTIQIDAKDALGNAATRQTASFVLRPATASLFHVFADKNGTERATVGSFSKQNQAAFDPARWAFTSGQINWTNYPTVPPFGESSVFRTELTHRANSAQAGRNWSIRIGKGGNIYSIKLPVVGEISPPSFRQPGWNLLSPWNDDGMTTTLNSSAVSNNDGVMNVYGNGYIHGSGMYISPAADALNNKPFHSPQFAEHFDAEERSYATVNLGVVPKPSVNRGDLLIYSKYRDVGNGVLELNYYYYNFGAITYDFAEAPWWMVRRSLFPDQIRGTAGANYEVFDRTYGVSHTFNVNSFAGWGASTQDADDPDAMTAAMVWGTDKDWPTQSALQSSGGDFWQKRTSAAAYGKVNDLARDGQLLTSVIFPIIKPGEGFHFRRYMVFGKLAEVAQTAATLVNQAEYKRIEFAAGTSGRLPLYTTTRAGQTVLSTTPPTYQAVPVGYSSPVPLKGSQPLLLMKNTESGQYFLSTDPYAAAGKKPFVNPYAPGDAKFETYQNRVIYQPYDGKTEWVSLLGFVLPMSDSVVPPGSKTLADATTATFVKGEKLDAAQLLLFTE